ncbi:MAG: peroxiredoxin [Patescibacteria group bacterium]
MIKIGEKAPEFSGITAYQRGEFKKVSLADYRDRWLVLFFYPRDFTFVCPTEIREFSRLEKEFENCGCAILGCSTDSEWSHKNWFERDLKEVDYPVLADTTQEVARAYSVLGPDSAAQRGTFIVDPQVILRWLTISDNSVGRSVKEILRALKALQTGELCPVEWEPGKGTLER